MGYKKGDKVVIKTSGTDIFQLNNKEPFYVFPGQNLGKLEDFMPAQEKIKMTVEEKGEFDELKATQNTPYSAMDGVDDDNYPILFEQLFNNGIAELDAVAQFEFARAWKHPELIEVVHEDVRTPKVAELYLWKYAGEYKLVADFDGRNENYYFTKSEVEKINKLEKFKHIDLVAAWEDGE